jgi:DNA transformation protein
MPTNKDFANYCCELLASAGPCMAKRMFGGWGISTDGLTIAIIASLGGPERLWLKASDDTRGQFEAAGCARFSYDMSKNGEKVPRSMNYYSAPEDAMDSPDAMRPWARLALECALAGARPLVTGKASKKASKVAKMPDRQAQQAIKKVAKKKP